MCGTETLFLTESIFRMQTQRAGIYFIESMLLCCLGGPTRLNNAMENNGVLNWHMIEQLYPLFTALQICLIAAIKLHVYTLRMKHYSWNNYGSFPRETGAQDDIQ